MLQSRILTAIIGLPILLGILLFAPKHTIAYFLCALVALSSFETTRLIFPVIHFKMAGRHFVFDTHPNPSAYSYGATVIAIVIFALVVFQLTPTAAGAVVAGLLIAMLVGLVLTKEGEEPVANILGFPFILAYGAFPWLSVWDLYLLEPNAGYLLYGLGVVWGGDTGAYFGGRRFGRTPLARLLSPKKTVEGAVFGILSSVFAGIAINIFYGWNLFTLVQCITISLIAGTCGQCGDLFESSLKRFAGVKDSGTVFPGHGGFLDRVDGLIVALPVVWFSVILSGIR